jgi:hypothetical protein
MADDKNKSLRDIIFKTVLSAVSVSDSEDDETSDEDPIHSKRKLKQRLELGTAKDLIASVAGWAGKGKDELVQMLFREIGQAVAAMLKEPLTQVIENRKLQISIEFTPRKKKDEAESKTTVSNRPHHRHKRKTK